MEERTTFLTLTRVGVGYGETLILILRLVLLLNSGKCGESSWFDVCFLFNVPWGIPSESSFLIDEYFRTVAINTNNAYQD